MYIPLNCINITEMTINGVSQFKDVVIKVAKTFGEKPLSSRDLKFCNLTKQSCRFYPTTLPSTYPVRDRNTRQASPSLKLSSRGILS